MDDPRVAVVEAAIADAMAAGLQWSEFPARILAALDAHAAAELAKAREGKVRVRVAIANDCDGKWHAHGNEGETDAEMAGFMADCDFQNPHAYGTFWVRPPKPTEIVGEVEAP